MADDGRARGLPAVLVSAADAAAAAALVDELIDNEVPASESSGGARVWRLVNKYYRADVRMCPRADDVPAHAIEAHVVHLAPHELDAATLEQRSAAAADAHCAVRLVLAECASASAALHRAALALNYELVPLREPPPPPNHDDENDAEPRGVLRARAALHAHAWPGLQRLDRAAAAAPSAGGGGSSSGEEEDEDEAVAVQRAELFAEAWGALEGARGAALQEGTGAVDAERRARAEQLVAAFCRALGHDLDAL